MLIDDKVLKFVHFIMISEDMNMQYFYKAVMIFFHKYIQFDINHLVKDKKKY